MKFTLLNILVFVIGVISMQAQTLSFQDPNHGRGTTKIRLPIVVDTATWEAVYLHIMKDSLKSYDKAPYEILAIGDNFRWYGGYGNYQLDSIQRANPDSLAAMSSAEFSNFWDEREPIRESLIVNQHDSTLTFYGKIFINDYRYEEPLPSFEWNLHEETCEIMGYDSYKATTRWRGRDWTAWYCDIPVSAGPWKFHGLPGLILRLEDSTGSHRFEAIEIKNTIFPFGYEKRLYCKTTREKYNDGLLDYQINAGKDMVDAKMVILSPTEEAEFRKRRLFSCPIELE